MVLKIFSAHFPETFFWVNLDPENWLVELYEINMMKFIGKISYAPWADLGFSRGRGGGFQTNFKNFTIFFWFDQIDFPSCPTALKDRVWPKFLRRRQFFEKKNRSKRRFWELFERFDKKSRFLARASLKINIIGAKGSFRKSVESVGQNGFLKKSLGRQVVDSLRNGGAPPISAPSTLN